MQMRLWILLGLNCYAMIALVSALHKESRLSIVMVILWCRLFARWANTAAHACRYPFGIRGMQPMIIRYIDIIVTPIYLYNSIIF